MSRGNLEHTEEMLYKQSREHLDTVDPHHALGATHHNTSWESDDLYRIESKSSSSLSFKIFILSSFLCIFAGAFLFYRMTVNPVVIDSKKIVVNMTTDPYVAGGEQKNVEISLGNNNTIPLLEAKMTFTYDKGGSVTGEVQKQVATKDIGEIAPLAVIKSTFPYIMYGSQEEKRPLTVRVDYKIKGSNATFSKEVSTEVTLSKPPLFVSLEGSETIVSGEQTEYTIVIKNTTTSSSTPALLTLSAPSGFSLLKTSESPLDKTLTWRINPLAPGDEKRITVAGTFTGAVGEKGALKVVIGSSKNDDTNIDELFSYDTKDLQYTTPGLTSLLALRTDRGESSVLRKGDKVDVSIQYKNQGLAKISYVEYKVNLPQQIDPRQIFVAQNGYYDTGTRSIIWSSDAFEPFLSLGVGQAGIVSFSFVVPDDFPDKSLPLSVSYKGMNEQVSRVVESSKDFSYAVSGATAFNAYTLYKDNDTPNTGPLPPKVDTETSYTAVLNASSQTDLGNAQAVFTIPSLYVKWLSVATSSASTTIAYDTKTKTVIWNIGELKKGDSVTAHAKLLVKPSLTHLGTSPAISSKVVFTAEDEATKEKIQQITDPLTTAIKDADPTSSLSRVVK